MGKRPLPDLPETGRHYVEHTRRARLASPGIERYVPGAGHGAKLAIGVALVAALIAAALLLR